MASTRRFETVAMLAASDPSARGEDEARATLIDDPGRAVPGIVVVGNVPEGCKVLDVVGRPRAPVPHAVQASHVDANGPSGASAPLLNGVKK